MLEEVSETQHALFMISAYDEHFKTRGVLDCSLDRGSESTDHPTGRS